MIKKLTDGRYLIDFHPHRQARRIRRIIKGPRTIAERALRALEDRALRQQFGWPERSTITIDDLVALVVADYEANQRKSLNSARQLRAFWKNAAGSQPAEQVSGDMLKAWAMNWKKDENLSNARVNRRMSFLLRGYRLAQESDPPKVEKVPCWRKLKEAPPRCGFREWEEFFEVRNVLPPHAKIPVTIEYWTGMRSGETLDLEWKQVHLDHTNRIVTIILAGANTKTSEPRMVVMGGDLYQTLDIWYRETRKQFPTCPWVCHLNERRLRSIKTAWQSACVKVGLGYWENPNGKFVGQRRYRGALMHDFRRTSVRNLVRAGVPENVAMRISGHKTRSVFDRYNIVNEKDLIEAGRKVVDHHQKKMAIPLRGQMVDSSPSSNSENLSCPRSSVG